MHVFYDLHLHSCLSPCGSEEMTPSNVARMAALAGYELIAFADHNSTGNCRSLSKAAAEAGILAVPAMELTTSEEVHILCLLPDLEAADAFGAYVLERLPRVANRSEFFGEQLRMDEDDGIIGREEILLANATSIGVGELPGLLDSYGGIAIPAHIDRNSFSILSNLGFLDRSLGFPAVEITAMCDPTSLAAAHPELKGLPFLVNSDAHDLSAIPDPSRRIVLGERSAKGLLRALREGAWTDYL